VAGVLWLSAMPGRLGAWDDFLDDVRRAPVDLVLCLTPRHEIERLSPDYADALRRGDLPFEWWSLPMRDFGLHAEMDDYERRIDAVAERLRAGQGVLLHCAAGIGRTGTVAACVLKQLGQSREEALAAVRRAGSNPQSAVQSGWVDQF
jgi:protein-tyrosine phosphatase